MVKRIKSKHHLVVLNWVVLPIFLSLRPYWFLCKMIVLWSDWPDLSDTILYKTGVYKARLYPEGLRCTRASDSMWVRVQKQGQLNTTTCPVTLRRHRWILNPSPRVRVTPPYTFMKANGNYMQILKSHQENEAQGHIEWTRLRED